MRDTVIALLVCGLERSARCMDNVSLEPSCSLLGRPDSGERVDPGDRTLASQLIDGSSQVSVSHVLPHISPSVASLALLCVT